MKNVIQFPDVERIEEQACVYLARLDAGTSTEEETRELQLWLAEDPRHRQTLMEVAQLMDNMAVLAELAAIFPLGQQPEEDGIPGQTSKGAGLLHAAYAVAASFMLAAVLFWSLHQSVDVGQSSPGPAVGPVAYSNEVGEIRTVSLADDSRITLNSDSRIEINYSDDERAVSLIRGEAEFDVAHQPDRPFVVSVMGNLVRAVGTAFNIEIGHERVEVLVTDGMIEVTNAEDTAVTSLASKVVAGQVLVIDADEIPVISQLGSDDIAVKLSWQRGELVFTGESLDEVVAEVSRYTGISIVIVDETIMKIPIGGRFPTGDVENLLNILEEGFDIQVLRIDNKLVHLASAEAQL